MRSFVHNEGCADDNEAANPGISGDNACHAGVDNGCNGSTDEDEIENLYVDADDDGWGVKTSECLVNQSTSLAKRGGECDDDEFSNPGIVEDDLEDSRNANSDGFRCVLGDFIFVVTGTATTCEGGDLDSESPGTYLCSASLSLVLDVSF